MPAVMLVFGVAYRGRWSVEIFDDIFWPLIERHHVPTWLVPRVSNTTAAELYYKWKARFIFVLCTWFELCCFVVCSRGVQSLCCDLLDGKVKLTADRSLTCFEGAEMWALHVGG